MILLLVLTVAFVLFQLKITQKVRVKDVCEQDLEAEVFFVFTEEILGCLQFVTNYRDRYGHGPNFFEGTLEDAVKAACLTKSAKDVSFLEIYSKLRLQPSSNFRENFSQFICTTTGVSYRMCFAGSS